MIKLILADMDGTLLNDEKQLPEELFDQIEQLYQKGIRFGVASGRQYLNLANRFDRIRDKLIFIAENGAYTRVKDEILNLAGLPKEDVKKWYRECADLQDAEAILCGAKSGYCCTDDPRFIREFGEYYDSCSNSAECLEKMMEDEILSFSVCDLKDVEGQSFERYKKYQDEYQVKISGSIWLDINRKDVNKGVAVKKIQERYNILPSETMVFGDYMNDYEMMRYADYSVAMENAYPQLKEACRYMTLSNNEKGVTRAIAALLNDELDEFLVRLK